MKILYVGGGYVGICSAAASADSGHNVLVYDVNFELINKFKTLNKDIIETAVYEEGLGDMIVKNKNRMEFTTDLNKYKEHLDNVDAIFLCLPTPEKDMTGETDMSYHNNACESLANYLKGRNNGNQDKYVLIINKSTVPVNAYFKTKKIFTDAGVKNFGIGSSPEFLVEGKAIKNAIKPDRIVVGAASEKDFLIFRDLYKRFYESSTDVAYIEVNPIEATASKLLANYMLFTRLASCFDVVGRLCESFEGLHYENVRRVLITDKRIGSWGFHNSLYSGGSCFIKDTRSLKHELQTKGAAADLVSDTLQANRNQLAIFLNRPEKEINFNWEGKKVALLGLAFKRDTNDIRNSPALDVAKFLIKNNVELIKAYDPAARSNFFKYFADQKSEEKIIMARNEEEAIENADVVIIATDWPEFREIYDILINKLNKGALIMDGRRMVQNKYKMLSDNGFDVIAVGSPLIKAKEQSLNI